MTTAKKKADNTKGAARAQATKKQGGRNIPWIGIVFGVVAVALVAAVLFSPDEAIGSEFGDVTVTGDALPPYVSGATPADDPAVGTPAPEFSGQDFNGDTVAVEHDGTPRAVIFLAHWCPHCQAEVPRIQAWLDGGGGVDGVEIVGVSTSMNSAQANWPASEWLDREGWTSDVVRDNSDNELLSTFGGSAFPFFVFIDADGNVAARMTGELDIATLEAAMQAIAP